jgi:hypothetical protein
MLTLTGKVVNVFQTPEGTDSEGKKYGGQYKVQLFVKKALKNGEKAFETRDLTIEDPKFYREKINQDVSIPVEAFAIQGGKSVPVRFRTASE